MLLDTCALLWLVTGSDRLSATARALIGRHPDRLHVSAVSALEVGIKHARGRLVLPMPPDEWFARAVEFHGLHEIPIDGRIAAQSTMLPAIHADPADRILVSTALCEGLTLLTPDDHIRSYPGLRCEW